MRNFGWPCYEGGRQGGYDGANLNICESLYGEAGAVTSPYFTYNHSAKVVSTDTCPARSSSIAGLAFYEGGNYPAEYDDALFFTDYSRECIWVMFAGADGLPDPSTRVMFDQLDVGPVDLEIGPGGDLFYVDFDTHTIRRITFFTANHADGGRQATPTSGPRRSPSTSTGPGRATRTRATRSPMPGTSMATASSTTRPPLAPRSPTRPATTPCGSG